MSPANPAGRGTQPAPQLVPVPESLVPLPPQTTPHNLRYLATKRDRLGHQIA